MFYPEITTVNSRRFNHTEFMLSAAQLSQAPADEGAEVAFAGRSNAGKSSAINKLVGNKKLAKTSKTPGRTQLLNFFQWQEGRRLVDLPGYGFAKVSVQKKLVWHRLLEAYFSNRKSLRGLVLVMDVRHPFKDTDEQMLQWCSDYRLDVHVLLTKSDKLTRGAGMNALLKANQHLKAGGFSASAQLFSAHNGTGVDELEARLLTWLA